MGLMERSVRIVCALAFVVAAEISAVAYAAAQSAKTVPDDFSLQAKISGKCKVVGEDVWYGFRRIKFDFGGCVAWVVEPSVKEVTGRPWTWTMQWAEA